MAVESNDVARVRSLLSTTNVELLSQRLNATDVAGVTPLHAAVQVAGDRTAARGGVHIDDSVFTELIAAYHRAVDADVNMADINGYTALHSACLLSVGADAVILPLLKTPLINVNVKNSGG